MLTKSFYRKGVAIFFAAALSIALTSCGEGDYYEYDRGDDDSEVPEDNSVEEPYDGYSDNYDQDCVDVGEEVWVGDEDPDGLDADSDGWGCEIWP